MTEMMRLVKRCTAIVMAAALVLLAACGSKPSSSSSASTPTIQVAMGRYLEEEIPFPSDMDNIVQMKKMADGSLKMLASKTKDRIAGPWYVYSSTDNGITWVEQPSTEWLKPLDDAIIMGMDFAMDGGMVISYVIYTDEIMAEMDAAIAAEDFDKAMAVQPGPEFIAYDATGTATKLDLTIPDPEFGGKGLVNGLRVADNGDIIVNDYYMLHQFDAATGKVKNKIITGEQPQEFLPCGDQLAVLDSGELQLFDLATGEKTESIPLPGGSSDGSLSWDGTAIYYGGSTGIYRKIAGGSVLEQAVDGALTSLNMPALYCSYIFPTDDKGFWGLFWNETPMALRYRYSEDVPTLPETQLRVYSLRDDENIRQAMGLYQRNHPDTQVVFDVGLPNDSTLTVSDALRTLSTQLLAGQGPDVLVLDGLPVDSYIEKKVLAELDDTLTSGMLPNIVKASREADGKLYALPARFTVPLALADSKAAAEITSLTTLAAYQARRTKELPLMPPTMGNPMHPVPSQLINTFYPVSAPTWFGTDGSINTAAISEFLLSIKTITDATDKAEWENAVVSTATDGSGYRLDMSAAYWLYDYIPMGYGHSVSFYDFAACEAAIAQNEDGKVFPLSWQVTGSFIPSTLLGIGSATKYPDAARELVSLVLSQQVQACEFDGYAVNEATFDNSALNPYPPTDDGMTYGTVNADGSYYYLMVKWPEVAYMEEQKAMIKSLNRSSRIDYVALQMVLDESAAYFPGRKSLEETVTSLSEKLKLYFAE